MKLVTMFASLGMLIAAVSSEAPAYGAPSAPVAPGPDPLAGINLAQLLSLVSQAGPARSVQQSYGAPIQQQQVQQSYGAPVANSVSAPSFSAPIAAQQVAYFGTQQTASANQGGYNSLGTSFNAPISSFQANPSNQYGAPSASSAFSSSSAVSSQYGAPAVRQQVSSVQRTVSQQYGAPAQQQQSSSVSGGYNSGSVSAFSGSGRSLSSQYGAPSTSVVRNNGGYSSSSQSSNSVGGGYSSQSQVQSSSSAIAGGYSGASGVNGGFASGSSSGIIGGQQGGYSSGNNFQTGGNNFQTGGNNFQTGGNNFQAGGNDGGVAQQRVHKHVYIHVAPPEEAAEQRPRRPSVPQVPEKHYKILFIKAPAPPTPEPLDLSDVVTPAPEQKTLVYVLLKKPEATPEIRIPTPAPTKPSKPEVYFIRYKSNEGANSGANGVNGVNDLNGAYGAPQVAAPIGQPVGVVNNPGAQYGAPAFAPANGGYNN